MKFSDVNDKHNLLTAIEKVHEQYSALNFLGDNFIEQGRNKVSLLEGVQSAADRNQNSPVVMDIDGCHVTMTFNKDPASNRISLLISTNPPIPPSEISATANNQHPLPKYESVKEKLALLCNKNFTLTKNAKGELCPSVDADFNANTRYTLGGADKYPLYKTHLNNLANIYKHIKSGEDIKNILIALATGSGKTFMQALWLLVIDIAGLDGLFVLPQELIEQFKKDFKKLLPDELCNKIALIDKSTVAVEDEAILNELGNKEINNRKRFVISSYEKTLDNHFNEVEGLSKNVLMTFDEQHKVTEVESRKLKLKKLAKKFLLMALTATPDKLSYELAGGKPVATMSNAMKAKNNQGNLPRFITSMAKTVDDKLAEADERLNTFKNKVKLRFVDTIQEPLSSPIMTTLQELPFMVIEQGAGIPARRPVGDKLLVALDDVNEMINLNNVIRQEENYQENDSKVNAIIYAKTNTEVTTVVEKKYDANNPIRIYHDENKKNRDKIYSFFNFDQYEIEEVGNAKTVEYDNVEKEIHRSYLAEKRQTLATKVAGVQHITLQRQIDQNILSSFVEYLIRLMTGLDTIQLNLLRKNNKAGLMTLIRSKLADLNAKSELDYYNKLIEDGIDHEGALKIATILSQIAWRFTSFSPFLEKLVMNSSLDNAIYEEALNSVTQSHQFRDYVKTHRTLYLMEGYNENKPFTHFKETHKRVFDENGLLNKDAKKRKHDITDTLDKDSIEYFYEPQSITFAADSKTNETIADNYFKLGFVGMYISNKKTEGFNDPNLATVIQVIPNEANSLNNPQKAIQAAGRARGLDETKAPVVIQAIGHGVKPCFDLNKNLNKYDFYPDYFAAMNKYKNIHFNAMAVRIKDEVMQWIYKNCDAKGKVDKNKLIKVIESTVANAVREINNFNDHKLKVTRQQISQLIYLTQDEINKEIIKLQEPNKMSFGASLLGNIIYGVSNVVIGFNDFVTKRKLDFYRYYIRLSNWFNKETVTEDSKVELLYLNILNKTSYKDLTEKGFQAASVINVITTKQTNLKKLMDVNAPKYLKESSIKQMNQIAKSKLLPGLSKWVRPDMQTMIMQAGERFNEWHLLLYRHEKDFNLLKNNINTIGAQQSRKEAVLRILKQIPGLAKVTLEQVVDVPSMIEASKERVKTAAEAAYKLSLKNYIASGQFLSRLRVALFEDDFEKISVIFANPQNQDEWSVRFYNFIKNDQNGMDEQQIFTLFKQFVRSKDARLSELELTFERANRADELFEPLQNCFNHIKQHPLEHLNDIMRGEINALTVKELAGSFVKFFEFKAQEQLLSAIEKYTKWPELYFEFKEQLEAINAIQNDSDRQLQALQDVVIQMLLKIEGDRLLPANFIHANKRDLKSTAESAAQQIEKYVEEISNRRTTQISAAANATVSQVKNTASSVVNSVGNFFGSLIGSNDKSQPVNPAVSVDLTKSQQNTAQNKTFTQEGMIYVLAEMLNDRRFIMMLEPFFSYASHRTLYETLFNEANKKNAEKLATDLITKNNIVDPSELKQKAPEEIAQMLIRSYNNVFTPKRIETVDRTLIHGFNQLKAKHDGIESLNPKQYLKQEDITFINDQMKRCFLPFILKWISLDHLENFKTISSNYRNWPEILKIYQNEFEKIRDLFDGQNTSDIDSLIAIEGQVISFVKLIVNQITQDSRVPQLPDNATIPYFSQAKSDKDSLTTEITALFGINCPQKQSIITVMNEIINETGMSSIFYTFDGSDVVQAKTGLSANNAAVQPAELASAVLASATSVTTNTSIQVVSEQTQIPQPANGFKQNKELIQKGIMELSDNDKQSIKLTSATKLSQIAKIFFTKKDCVVFDEALRSCSDLHWILFNAKDKLEKHANLNLDKEHRDFYIFNEVAVQLQKRLTLPVKFSINPHNIFEGRSKIERLFDQNLEASKSSPWYKRWIGVQHSEQAIISSFCNYIQNEEFIKSLHYFYNANIVSEIAKIINSADTIKALLLNLYRLGQLNLKSLLAEITTNNAAISNGIQIFNDISNIADYLDQEYCLEKVASVATQQYQNLKNKVNSHKAEITRGVNVETKFASVITNYLLKTQKPEDFDINTLSHLYKISFADNLDDTQLLLSAEDVAHIGTDLLDMIKNNKNKHLDKNKLTQLFTKEILPVISDEAYLSIIESSMGYFSEEDFMTMLCFVQPELKGATHFEPYIHQIQEFIKLIKDQQFSELIKKYFNLNTIDFNESDDMDVLCDQLLGIKVMKSLRAIMEEVTHCKKYYYQVKNKNHNKEDRVTAEQADSLLVKKMTSASPVAECVSTAHEDYTASLSLQGTCNSFESSNRVQTLAHQNIINIFKHVNGVLENMAESDSSNANDVLSVEDGEDTHLIRTHVRIFNGLKELGDADLRKPNCPADALQPLIADAASDSNMHMLETYRTRIYFQLKRLPLDNSDSLNQATREALNSLMTLLNDDNTEPEMRLKLFRAQLQEHRFKISAMVLNRRQENSEFMEPVAKPEVQPKYKLKIG